MKLPSKYFFSFIAFVFALILSLEIINGRFWLNDFRVYYGAADAYVHGEQVYQRVFGEDTGLYKYSPVLLWVFAPATLVPYFVACILHYVLIAFAFVFSIRLAFRLAAEYFEIDNKYKIPVLLATTIFTLNHLFRELHLGNVNVILVFILLLAFHLQERKQYKFSGFLFALAVLAKPYLVVLFIPFLIAKKFTLIRTSVIATLLIVILFTLGNGIASSIHLQQEWILGMMNHSEFLVSTNTFQSILAIWFSANLSGLQAAGLLLLLVFFVFFASRRKNIRAFNRKEEYLLFAVLLASIPCLVITDTEHFLFALPLIVLLVAQALQLKHKGLLLLSLVFLVAYGINLGDVIGDRYSVALEHSGVLGIGNIALIVISILITAKTESLKKLDD